MSRYGNDFKDNLFDEIEFQYRESHMTPLEFLKLLMELITDLVNLMEYEDNP